MFANPNDTTDPRARIISSYDKSGVSDMWCTQDQISKFDQVCSYTGIDNDGKCKTIKIQQNDQHQEAQKVFYQGPDTTWYQININVSNLVPTGTNVKTSQ